MDTIEAKRLLRREMKARLAANETEAFAHGGSAVAEPLLAFVNSLRAAGSMRVVALFASLPAEIDTRPIDRLLRDAGIVRALPAVVHDALVFRALVNPLPAADRDAHIASDLPAHDCPPGVLGIPTPSPACPLIDPRTCHAVVVPGLAFDRRGRRLGYGRGFYDRALAGVDMTRAVAVFMDDQLVDEVPCEPHDVRLHWLCTPARGVFAADGDSASR